MVDAHCTACIFVIGYVNRTECDEDAVTEQLPRPIAWFAPWTWSLWVRMIFIALIVISAITAAVLLVLGMLYPVDIYVHDTYIRLWP